MNIELDFNLIRVPYGLVIKSFTQPGEAFSELFDILKKAGQTDHEATQGAYHGLLHLKSSMLEFALGVYEDTLSELTKE